MVVANNYQYSRTKKEGRNAPPFALIALIQVLKFPLSALAVTSTALVATAGPIGMPISTSLTAIGFVVFHDRVFQADDTETRIASAFHLSDGCHNEVLVIYDI